MSNGGVCRRAPATPGLLITWQPLSLCVLLPYNIILDICINKNNTSVASNCKIILISHHWFKGYGNFPGWVKFAYRWSFIGGGSAIIRDTLLSFSSVHVNLRQRMSGIMAQHIVSSMQQMMFCFF